MEFIFQVLHLIFNASHPHKLCSLIQQSLHLLPSDHLFANAYTKARQSIFIVSHQRLPLLGTHPINFHYCPWVLTGWGDPGMEGCIRS